MTFPLPDPMRRALDLASHAADMGEVPVGAVVMRDGAIVATSANAMRGGCDPTAHAEIVAIRAAAQALGTQAFPLMSVKPQSASLAGHKVQVKGVLTRQKTVERINVMSLDSVGPTCGG